MEKFNFGFRYRLPFSDLEFISRQLAPTEAESEAILRLLTDPETVDSILDLPQLYQELLESPDLMQVSPRLYFYILLRHALMEADIDDPEMTDYLSGVLEKFGQQGSHHDPASLIFYVVDWLAQLDQSSEEEQFHLYVSAGNQLLVLTGVFADYLHARTRRRGAPPLHYYEEVGRHSYRSAADHPRSKQAHLEQFYLQLAGQFGDLRQVLQDFSNRLVSFEAFPPGLLGKADGPS